ncbi:MAG: hypothetical protein H6Q68_3197 [Firmicutes bacterium]|nr:hypothetical protein [Bacillota bacterium]
MILQARMYPLSYKILVKMMKERSLKLIHTEIFFHKNIGLLNEKSNQCLDLAVLERPRKLFVELKPFI